MPVLSPSDQPPSSGGGCGPWATELPCARDEDTPEDVARALSIATWVVWGLSGRTYGIGCPQTIRPCVADPCGHRPGHIVRRCADRGYLLDLGHGIHDVSEVVLDGAELLPAFYRLERGRFLRRLDGLPWPASQNFDLEPGELDTWTVTYRAGVAPPEAGVLAVQVLACEVLAAIRPLEGRRCRLPRRTRTVARQGVTVELVNPSEFLVAGRTGLAEVDLFLAVANPGGQPSPPRVWSPDYDSRRPHA